MLMKSQTAIINPALPCIFDGWSSIEYEYGYAYEYEYAMNMNMNKHMHMHMHILFICILYKPVDLPGARLDLLNRKFRPNIVTRRAAGGAS